MKVYFNKALFIFTVFMLSFSAISSNTQDKHDNGEHGEKFNVNEMLMHHISDAHEWHLWGHKAIYLPVILIDNGSVKTFCSSHFYHGETKKVEVDGKHFHYIKGEGPASKYAMFHEKIYKLDEEGELKFHGGHPVNAKPLDFSITRNVAFMFLTVIVLLWIALSTAKSYKNGISAPKGVAKFVEPIILFVRDDIAKDNIGEEKHKKFLPLLLTMFFFIWIANLLGLIPVVGSNFTGNISVTMFLALVTLVVILFSANKNYWKHIFATPGVPLPLLVIMVPIELAGILTKPFALMVRLFANITAGHIIILALISIIFINQNIAWGALSVPMALFISILELLVAFLQAFLFTMLTALFIGMAVEDAHH